jgi:hypothetical protein
MTIGVIGGLLGGVLLVAFWTLRPRSPELDGNAAIRPSSEEGVPVVATPTLRAPSSGAVNPLRSPAVAPEEAAGADGFAWIAVAYDDGAPAQGLVVYPAPSGDRDREVMQGGVPPLGILDGEGRLRVGRGAGDLGNLVIAYDDALAALIPGELVTSGSRIVIARPDAVEFVLDPAGRVPEENLGEFDLFLSSFSAKLFKQDWFRRGGATPDAFFETHHLAIRELDGLEYFLARRLSCRAGVTRWTVSVPPCVPPRLHTIAVQECPFGWWIDTNPFDRHAREILLEPYPLEVHFLEVHDEFGGPLPCPHEVRVVPKRWEGGRWQTMYEYVLPTAGHQVAVPQVRFVIPPPHEENPCSIMASWGDDYRLESEPFEVVPTTVVLRRHS